VPRTQSLFQVGVVRDVNRMGGTALAAVALGQDARQAFPYEGMMYLVDEAGEIESFMPCDGDPQLAEPRGEPSSSI